MKKNLFISAAAVAITLVAGCGSSTNDGNGGGHGGHTVSAESSKGAEHNPADVMFAQMMIPHHEQAIEMAELVTGKAVSTELTTLAQQIKDAQQPEIDTLTGWLNEWGESPDEGTPSSSGMDHGSGHGEMDGMMSDEDMQSLSASDGAEFESMWLSMMIEHHQGAIDMATAQIEGGKHAGAVAMANEIVTTQQAEIDTMQGMLDALG